MFALLREREYLYSTPQSPTFSIHLTGVTLQADKGIIRATEKQHEEIQNLIVKGRRFDLSQNMVLIDLTEAEKVAQAHMREEANKPNAARGMTSTSHSAAKMQMLEGHEIPDKLSELDVKECDAVHGEDTKVDPVTGKTIEPINL